MVELIIILFLILWIVFEWLFYLWGASIAEKKGYPRSYGWWAVFFGLLAILVLALLPDRSTPAVYIPHASAPRSGVAEQLERLASLKDKGVLTEEEFETKKRALLERR